MIPIEVFKLFGVEMYPGNLVGIVVWGTESVPVLNVQSVIRPSWSVPESEQKSLNFKLKLTNCSVYLVTLIVCLFADRDTR